jgi:hypothetical protein
MIKRSYRAVLAVTAVGALVLAVGAGAGTKRGPELSLRWQAPTPKDGAAFSVEAGQALELELAARSTQAQVVLIGKRPVPNGVRFRSGYGRPSRATVEWKPTARQVGTHVLTFTAKTRGQPQAHAQPRSFLVNVSPATLQRDKPFPLNGARGMSRWAYVLTKIPARARPSARAKIITRLQPLTPEQTQNLVQILEGQTNEQGEYWVRVRLPILPNGTTGWIPRGALGAYNKIWTHLVIDRRLFTATLYKRGRAVFRSRVGVGLPYWPTPAGKFYVRENHRLLGPDLRPDRLRHECSLGGSDRLARGRLHRNPRHESAGDPARPRLAWLRSHAEPGHSAAGAPDAARHAGHDPLVLFRGPALQESDLGATLLRSETSGPRTT